MHRLIEDDAAVDNRGLLSLLRNRLYSPSVSADSLSKNVSLCPSIKTALASLPPVAWEGRTSSAPAPMNPVHVPCFVSQLELATKAKATKWS